MEGPRFGRPKRPTLRDIAQSLGLSVNTVSRALANKDNISEETKARVRAEAHRLGYVPNSLARSLVTGASRTIGLVLTNPSNPMYAELITVLEQRARRYGYSLLLATSQDDLANEIKAVEMLLRQRVDGILIVPVQGAHEHLLQVRRSGVPLVLINRDIPEVETDFVGSDNFHGAYEATKHLIALGHNRIALLFEEIAVSSIQHRVLGYRQAMADHGLTVDESLVCPIPSSRVRSPLWNPEGAYTSARHLAQMEPSPTAMFVANDFFALGVYRALAEAGLRIPQDVAVVGYSDFVFSRYLVPPLTSVQSASDQIGRIALRLLLDRIHGKSMNAPPQRIVLQPRLMVRGSCGSKPMVEPSAASASSA